MAEGSQGTQPPTGRPDGYLRDDSSAFKVVTVNSIRFKITAITIAEILTAILCVFFASFYIIQAENDQRSVEMMGLIAQDTRKSLEKYTENIEQSVEIAAHLASNTLDSTMLIQCGIIGADATTERSSEQTQQLDNYLADYLKRLQGDFSIVAGHTRGVVTYYYCISPDISTSVHGFFYSRVGKTGFDEREPLDARELDPNDLEHTTWYYTPIKRGRPSWVGPYTAHFLGEMWICSYLVPIYKSGAFIGVLGMDIPLDTLVSLVSSIRIYDTGFACLFDEKGNVIYHPELEQGSKIDLPFSESLLHMESSGDALIRFNENGQDRQLSFTTLSNGMKLAIVAPTAEVNASSIRLTQTVLPIAVTVIVLFAAATLLLMSHIILPLQRLTAAAKRLATADYDVELDYKSKDEVGALTTAFQQMRNQLQAYIADLNRKVLTDDLTGLPNQRHFFELAVIEKQRMIEAGENPVFLYINLVGMKHFNRQFGFSDGDRLICAVADILARRFGRQSTSRFGQDHFAVTTNDENLEKRLYGLFAECRDANNGKTLPLSIGIYQNSVEDVDASIACDRAKFACDKRRGSYVSGFCYFDRSMLTQIDTFRYVISHLDQALEERWIKVYYQPIVRAVNGKVCDEEALSRWIDPVMGLLSPAEFVPALENSGLIYLLDLYVLDRVLEKINQQKEVGLTVVPHSINLSRSDFDVLDMVDEICRRVDEAGVPHDRITIEITESIIGSDFDFMKTQVERFQSLGFPVWMDDFGSGYSSLDFLQNIRFDLLKFDMRFMRDLDRGESGKVILTQLMQMATALGVDTLCEGVETEDRVRFLREIGCSKLQGYYYCPPIPYEDIVKRYDMGTLIGFENPQESDYFETIGKVNLYDLAALFSEEEDSLSNIFNTLPMGIMEIRNDKIRFVRTNQSYRDFMRYLFGPSFVETSFDAIVAGNKSESFFVEHARECCEKGTRVLFDAKMPDGSVAHFLMRHIGTNPVTGTVAVGVAVLSLSAADEQKA